MPVELTLCKDKRFPKVGEYIGLKQSDGSRTAYFRCPTCRRFAVLADHTISTDGKVSPSVVCSYEDCSFHDFIVLKGWKP